MSTVAARTAPAPFHFGHGQRALFGACHAPSGRATGAMLLCPPLLQEGIRCHRALWTLAEALADAGSLALRFDWYGSGDSGGDTEAIELPGLLHDIDAATTMLRVRSDGAHLRALGLRSAALPLIAHASAGHAPVDLVLWAPQLDGRAMVAAWREQHLQQLHAVGRYLGKTPPAGDGELLGFTPAARLIEQLSALDATQMALPSGSSLLLAQWRPCELTDAFVQRQRAAGVEVERLALDGGDEPAWDDPVHFDTQLYPRRAVNALARHLAEAA